MALNDDILQFVADVEYRIGVLNSDVVELWDDSRGEGSLYRIKLQEMRELSAIADTMIRVDVEVLNENDAVVYNVYEETEAEIRQFMSDVRVRYDIVTTPYMEIPSVIIPYFIGDFFTATGGTGLPGGGLPGWYLTLNVNNQPVWAEFPSVIDGGVL
jgi:hypothetical protein